MYILLMLLLFSINFIHVIFGVKNKQYYVGHNNKAYKLFISHDVVSGSELTPCSKIDRYSGTLKITL